MFKSMIFTENFGILLEIFEISIISLHDFLKIFTKKLRIFFWQIKKLSQRPVKNKLTIFDNISIKIKKSFYLLIKNKLYYPTHLINPGIAFGSKRVKSNRENEACRINLIRLLKNLSKNFGAFPFSKMIKNKSEMSNTRH
ncbi:hypothetical protein BpHYR1_021217 [Brachionus plicatilis]|uniref:Uncharacterized protein n=1 Tax=Brachionus plicatilis TaxID=10195 RepID=A0A3M7T324_BRAPC|nr:hypothetical protein BpHYR1_021217 [Brachionus plicatilis]